MRRWSARLAACAVAVPLLLAGCSSKHEASQSLPTASKTTAAKTLPPLGPADFPVPADARKKTPAGVIAFSNYYVQLSNHLLASFDSQPLRDLSANCQACDELANGYDRARTAGYTSEGGELTVTSTGTAVVKGDDGELSLLLRQAAVTVKDHGGSVVPGQSTGEFSLGGGMALHWDTRRSTWLVTQWTADKL